MVSRILILWLLALPINGVAQEQLVPANAERACSGGIRGTASIGSEPEQFTASTIIQADPVINETGEAIDYTWPIYNHTIRFSDGTVMLEYEARGLFNNAGPLSCDDRLQAAQRQLVEGLSDAKRLDPEDAVVLSLPVRMAQLSACLINANACNTEPHYVNPSAELREFGVEAFNSLLESEPISFSVFVSDCQIDTYLYEPSSRTVLNVESMGC